MVAGNASSARVWPWSTARRQLMYIGTPLLAFTIAWWASSYMASWLIWSEAVAYAAAHLVLIGLRRMGLLRLPHSIGLGFAVDLIMGFLLLAQVDTLGMGFYPIYTLIALRTLSVYRLTPAATLIPFIFGLLYLFLLALTMPLLQLPVREQVAATVLLIGALSFGAAAIWASTSTVRTNFKLQQELDAAQRVTDLRVAQLERSANDLRARMREQHALEEGLRVITSTLSLDDVLGQIVDSTVQMLGGGRVNGVTLSMANGAGFDHRSPSADMALAPHFADALALRTSAQHVPLIINDLGHDSDLDAKQPGVASVLSVPLFVGEGVVRGALTVVSFERSTFDSVDARHLSALALQAGIAMQNAELHSQMLQQRQLLEAVMRDITEGLVVLNAQQEIVLMNPLGRRLMNGSASAASVREHVLELATTMRTDQQHILNREIKFGGTSDDEASGSVYQAWASLVRQHGSDEPLVAVVFHDITAQKEEERGKQEFISMVAHELRNPLHSMNGFVKIVLQGKVGALTDMQQEFLGIVDSQITLMNGRIAELLEYNRVKSGRLVLNPQRGDIPILVVGTVQRLIFQAQNNGLTLANEVANDLPECYFDAERIGQVLTNLVENAIKATPPGGHIRVTSELYEDELWLRVYDTGVGIAPEEQSKIFQAFYRAHDRASSKGNHLGLGLAICQQIVEGHRGRIWVESELGQGSCFSFSLPLIGRERTLGEDVRHAVS